MTYASAATTTRAAMAVAALTMLIGGWLCWLLPERSWAWLPVMAAMPLVWLIHRQFAAAPMPRSMINALTGAGLMLSLAMLAVALEQLAWFSVEPGELSKRAFGVIIGGLVVAYANVIPKQATSARRAGLLRFCGWMLVLGGLAYAVVWLLAPLPWAQVLAMAALLTAVVLVAARVLWSVRSNSNSPTAS
jgi:hypothetical protein